MKKSLTSITSAFSRASIFESGISPAKSKQFNSQFFSSIPHHVAIVMDGNGRWAQQRSLPRIAGHKAGAKAVERAIKFCSEKKIKILTLFAFSSENWGRPRAEVDFLMSLFLKTLKKQTKVLHENNVQIRVVGDILEFPTRLQESIFISQEKTAANTGLKLIIAANYSGRWDIIQATRRIAEKAQQGRINIEQIDSDFFQQHLSLADLPDPDLLIRTSGEQRISNFMLWQFAYTEFFFTDILWPDFDAVVFEQALKSYAARQRRFGLVEEYSEAETARG